MNSSVRRLPDEVVLDRLWCGAFVVARHQPATASGRGDGVTIGAGRTVDAVLEFVPGNTPDVPRTN